ncbi:MAG: nucleotidyltransferase [Chrysiogenales bacterium]
MDTEKLLSSLKESKVEFVVIGATAFPVYGHARATLDIDLFVRPEKENIKRLKKALMDFGYDLIDISEEDMLKNKLLIRQYALETDIHPFVKGISFEDVWRNRIGSKFGDTEVYFPCLDDMIRMKKAAGRTKDLEDLKYLRKIKRQKK